MLRYQSELFQPSMKLVDVLKMSTREDLKQMAEILSLSVPSKLRKKDEYANHFAEAVLAYPNMWLPRLTHYELTLLDKLVKAGADSYVESSNSFLLTTLEAVCFIAKDSSRLEEGKVRYTICDELREAVAPYLDDLLTSKKQTVRFMIEQYVYGIVNLYGFLPYVNLMAMLREYLQDSATVEEIIDSLANSLLVQRFTFDFVDSNESSLCIQSPFLVDFKMFEKKVPMGLGITSMKTFSKEEVYLAGMMPLNVIPNPHSDELKEFMMKKLGCTEEKADTNLLYLWCTAQMDENPMSVINSIINHKLSSIQELQEAIELFTDYLNHCPYWFLKGYSSEEASVLRDKGNLKNNPPHMVADPNMEATGMGIPPEMQSVMDNMFQTIPSDCEVGRNDPCPCGSGKKYKKCCGRNN